MDQQQTITEPLLSAQEVATMFGLKLSTVYRYRALLGGFKLGGVHFRRETVERRIREIEAMALAEAGGDHTPAAAQKLQVVEIPKPKHNHLSWG